MGAPPVALDDHPAADDPEVDLVSTDGRMERRLRETERAEDLGHQRFEIAVGWFVVDRPTIERVPQCDYPVTSMLRVTHDQRSNPAWCDEACHHHRDKRCVDAGRIDGTEVEKGS